MCYLRANQIDENHQTDDLPKAAGGLGEVEELNNYTVPQQFAHKGNNHKRHKERNQGSDSVSLHFALDGGIRISKGLNGGAGRGSQARHLSTGCF